MVANTKIRDTGGILRTISKVSVRDTAGTLRVIKTIKVRDPSNTLRTVFLFFQASVSSTLVTGSYNGSSGAPQNIGTSGVQAIPIGGTSPFTYSWTRVDIGPVTWTISNTTNTITSFTALGVGAGNTESARFQCTITDAGGNVVVTTEVTARADNNSTI